MDGITGSADGLPPNDDSNPNVKPADGKGIGRQETTGGARKRSAGDVDVKAGPQIKKKKSGSRSKKPRDMPNRPLTAYNLFFKHERERMLSEYKPAAQRDTGDSEAPKIGFESMAKIIAAKWKELRPEEVEPYKELAKDDLTRYREEMEDYQAELARRSRLEHEQYAREGAARANSVAAASGANERSFSGLSSAVGSSLAPLVVGSQQPGQSVAQGNMSGMGMLPQLLYLQPAPAPYVQPGLQSQPGSATVDYATAVAQLSALFQQQHPPPPLPQPQQVPQANLFGSLSVGGTAQSSVAAPTMQSSQNLNFGSESNLLAQLILLQQQLSNLQGGASASTDPRDPGNPPTQQPPGDGSGWNNPNYSL